MTRRNANQRSTPGVVEHDADGAVDVRVTRFRVAGPEAAHDQVACEEPLEIRLAGASLAVVMRTPGYDEELALGFLVTERVIASAEDVESVRHCTIAQSPEAAGNVIRVTLRPGVAVDFDSLRRNLYASSSCGICGKASIENALGTASRLDDVSRIRSGVLSGMMDELLPAQTVFARTGGLHAVGLFDAGGRLLVAREDVGRHNAVDKVIGWALQAGRLPLSGHVLAVSGRSSYEIVQKALFAGIPVVAAISAPTSLAVEFARDADMTLLGFVRGGGFNVYSGGQRIIWPESGEDGDRGGATA